MLGSWRRAQLHAPCVVLRATRQCAGVPPCFMHPCIGRARVHRRGRALRACMEWRSAGPAPRLLRTLPAAPAHLHEPERAAAQVLYLHPFAVGAQRVGHVVCLRHGRACGGGSGGGTVCARSLVALACRWWWWCCCCSAPARAITPRLRAGGRLPRSPSPGPTALDADAAPQAQQRLISSHWRAPGRERAGMVQGWLAVSLLSLSAHCYALGECDARRTQSRSKTRMQAHSELSVLARLLPLPAFAFHTAPLSLAVQC